MAKRILILFILAGVLIAPEDLSSCGPFLPTTIFTAELEPFDAAPFLQGHLDILQTRYKHIYLMAAYRYLAGVGLTSSDQQALQAPPTGMDFWMGQSSPAAQEWLRARVQVGAPRLDQIGQLLLLPSYAYILNCGDDAFHNAAATLVEREHAGASHADLRAWVAAQDLVFANCSGPPSQPRPRTAEPSIPSPLPATAAPWMQFDRAYQIAAAEFYAGQFDAAAAGFLQIAANRPSPWHSIAPYLGARALIRKTTMVDPSAAPAAQEQLRKVLADPDCARWHDSARGLARFLRAQSEPAAVTRELAQIVATEKNGVAGAMHDYHLMLARYSNHLNDVPRDDDLTDWILSMQYSSNSHALEKWRATHSLPWLVAALTYAFEAPPDLMSAAAQVPDNSPAFLTIAFHRLRLMPAGQARPLLDAILRRHMPASDRNLFLAARMRLARDWDECLRYAPRTVAGAGVEGAAERPATAPEQYFDDDAARILNLEAPLPSLVEAARNPSLPRNLQLQVARAVWVRAILLNDSRTATEIAPRLASLAPSLKPYGDFYVSAPDDKTRAFAAAWLLLNNPGMRPSIDAGAGRLTPTAKLDPIRDNWWCPPIAAVPDDALKLPLNAPLELLYQGHSPEARFLSAAQRARDLQEQQSLAKAPAAPTLMARVVVEWVEAHPDDFRAPEVLRLAVRAAHYACSGDGETRRWAKRAFQLLHHRYPGTEAARRTPYWYGSTGR